MPSAEIDTYLNALGTTQQEQLERVREIVLKEVPDATQGISYGMPVLKYRGKYLIGFAAFKNHMSIFPGAAAIEALQTELAEYRIAKGTIQFTETSPLPESLIVALLRVRIHEIIGK